MNLSFPKRERIVSQKLIDELFSKTGSQSVVAFPVRAVCKVIDAPQTSSATSVQLLVSVPKKRLHHAVDRNRVKRQLREAWRHHRQPLTGSLPEGKCLLVAFVWLSDRLYASGEVSKRVQKLIGSITSKL